MGRPRSRIVVWIRRTVLAAALLFVGLLVAAACYSATHRSKYDPVPSAPRAFDPPELGTQEYTAVPPSPLPRDTHEPLRPIEQREGHTCGFLALSSVYRAYGLDPEERRLRFRLGVDAPALPSKDDTLGTLHPDLFRVARQDGFVLEALDPATDTTGATAERLARHAEEHVALVLLRRPSGGLHWIAVEGADRGHVHVVDSLSRDVETCEAPELLRRDVLSVLLLRPGGEAARSSVTKAHAAGLDEMRRVGLRLSAKGD